MGSHQYHKMINHDDSPILRLGHFQTTPCTPWLDLASHHQHFPGGFHIAFGKHSCAKTRSKWRHGKIIEHNTIKLNARLFP